MSKLAVCLMVLSTTLLVVAQQPTSSSNEKRVPLTEAAVALDATGAPALEATLTTPSLNGAPDAPVTNLRMVVRNASAISFGFVSGLATFYDSAGVRCGEGIFKTEALAANESSETDAPGIRIRCAPLTWRIVATSLLPRVVPAASPSVSLSRSHSKLMISVDGEQHPIQLDKPLTLSLGNRQRTIVVREVP